MSRAADYLSAMRALPVVPLETILGDGGLLVLAPHQDDESLGCGGLIAAARAAGRGVTVAFLTDGAGSHPNSQAYPPERLRLVRQGEAKTALALLGVEASHVVFMRLPDTDAPHDGEKFETAVEALAVLIGDDEVTIATTWIHDPHGDHGSAAKIARAASRLTGRPLVFFPVWGWTLPDDAWVPDDAPSGVRLDISAHLAAKQAAIAAHVSQGTNLIDDDPNGFCLQADMLAHFAGPFEVFVRD